MSVVISAQGAATAFGIEAEDFERGLSEGRTAITPFSERLAGFPPGFGAAVPTVRSALRKMPGGRSLRPSTMSRPTWLTAVGLGLALQDAGLAPDDEEQSRSRRSVLVGTQTNMPDMERHLRFWRLAGADSEVYSLDPERTQKAMRVFGAFEYLRLMNNMPGAHAALQTGSFGLVNTLLGGAASGLQAVVRAVDEIAMGRSQQILAGGVGTAVNEHRSLLRQAQGFWLPKGSAQQDCRPWEAGSMGSIPGEASCFFLLETAAEADGAGRKAHALVSAAESAFAPLAAGREQAAVSHYAGMLDRVLNSSSKQSQDIDLIFGTGSGVPALDRIELEVLQKAGLDQIPRISLVPSLGFCEAATGPLGISAALHEFRSGNAGNVLVFVLSPEGNSAALVLSSK